MRFGASHLKPRQALQGAVASGNCREELDLGVLLGRFRLGIRMGTGKAGSTAGMWSPKGGEAGNVTRERVPAPRGWPAVSGEPGRWRDTKHAGLRPQHWGAHTGPCRPGSHSSAGGSLLPVSVGTAGESCDPRQLVHVDSDPHFPLQPGARRASRPARDRAPHPPRKPLPTASSAPLPGVCH